MKDAVGLYERDYMRDLPGYRAIYERSSSDPRRPAQQLSFRSRRERHTRSRTLYVVLAVLTADLVLRHLTIDGRHWSLWIF